METKKVYIYRFTTIPGAVQSYGGNITIIEKNGVVWPGDYVDVEDFDYVCKHNLDNLDNIIDGSYGEGICYDFYSFRNDRLLDFKMAISGILQNKINNYKKKIQELEALQENLKITQGVFDVVEDNLTNKSE